MLSIKDVPVILEKEGEEASAIPLILDSELGQAIVQCGQGIHDRGTDGDNVQILETMASVSKVQMITLAQDGIEKIQQESDQAKRQKAEGK